MREYHCALKAHDDGGVVYVNTFAIKVELNGPDLAEASDQAVADHVASFLGDPWLECLSTAYTADTCTVTGILGHEGEAVHNINSPGQLTLFAGSPAPKECCMVLTWKTEHVGRSGRGRVFIPSPRDSTYIKDATSWKGPTELTGHEYYDAVKAFGDAFLGGSDFTDDGFEYHISGRVWSRVDGVTYDVVQALPRLPVHWLRSRSTAP